MKNLNEKVYVSIHWILFKKPYSLTQWHWARQHSRIYNGGSNWVTLWKCAPIVTVWSAFVSSGGPTNGIVGLEISILIYFFFSHRLRISYLLQQGQCNQRHQRNPRTAYITWRECLAVFFVCLVFMVWLSSGRRCLSLAAVTISVGV